MAELSSCHSSLEASRKVNGDRLPANKSCNLMLQKRIREDYNQICGWISTIMSCAFHLQSHSSIFYVVKLRWHVFKMKVFKSQYVLGNKANKMSDQTGCDVKPASP